jgi:hypothetical protein
MNVFYHVNVIIFFFLRSPEFYDDDYGEDDLDMFAYDNPHSPRRREDDARIQADPTYPETHQSGYNVERRDPSYREQLQAYPSYRETSHSDPSYRDQLRTDSGVWHTAAALHLGEQDSGVGGFEDLERHVLNPLYEPDLAHGEERLTVPSQALSPPDLELQCYGSEKPRRVLNNGKYVHGSLHLPPQGSFSLSDIMYSAR